MKIGNLDFPTPIFLAPMAGVTDTPYRILAREMGCAMAFAEMVSVLGIRFRNEKTLTMLKSVPEERPLAMQLFGAQPEPVAEAAAYVETLGCADVIDFNMGCPAPKIIKNHCGCDLMRHLDDAQHLIELCRAATKQSGQALSVKMRLGWSQNIAVEFAHMCERAGVDRLIVHGRLGVDGYRGVADYVAIAQVKAAVKIPVIANGDVRDRASYEKCLAETHADGVMVGRALCGAPWKINLDDSVPTYERIVELMQLQKRLHNGNPSDLIKHWLSYQKQLKKYYPDRPVPTL